MMADRWIDVSSFQQPSAMKWVDWHIPRGQYRLALGRKLDVAAQIHRNNMRQAGMLTGSYGVPVEYAPIIDQAWFWVDNTPLDDENDDWVDAERQLLTEPMLRAYCDSYDLRSKRHRLAIYTGFPWWTTHIPEGARARYRDYPLIIAGYPFDSPPGVTPPMDAISVARRSNPPVNRRPTIPPLWTVESGWQHTSQGSMPGYDRFLDMGIYQVNPSGPIPIPPADDSVLREAIHLHAAAITGLVE